MMHEGFDADGFTNWMCEEFTLDRILDSYALQMLEHIIDYAYEYKNRSKDQLAWFIAEMLPQVKKVEVAKFCEDSILTDSTLKELGRI